MQFTTDIYTQIEDIHLICNPVPEFPNGINQKFLDLEADYPDPDGKGYYGISWMDDHGQVIYKAAAATKDPGSDPKPGYEKFLLHSGNYLAITLANWMDKLPMIKEAFEFLMKDERFRGGYPCVEWYISDAEMMVMVRI